MKPRKAKVGSRLSKLGLAAGLSKKKKTKKVKALVFKSGRTVVLKPQKQNRIKKHTI